MKVNLISKKKKPFLCVQQTNLCLVFLEHEKSIPFSSMQYLSAYTKRG